MEEINEWLSKPVDYSAGLMLADRHIRNRNIVKYLHRKQDMAKLIYELQKVVGVKQTTKPETTPTPTSVQAAVMDSKAGKFNPDTLPDQVKTYYEKATQAYHNARKSHYAMKAARTDEERAKHRKDTISFIAESRHNWAILDEWKTTGELPKSPQSESKSTAALASSLSRDMAKLVKLTDENEINETKATITETVAELNRLGRNFAPKTLKKLTEYNIPYPNAKVADDREVSEGDIR